MTLRWPARNRDFGFLDVLGLFGVLGLLVARFIPVARLPFWGCAIRQTTGWPCPACGLTRVADHVSQGDFAGAWGANPLGTVAAVIFALLGAWMLLHVVLAIPWPEVELREEESRWLRTAAVLSLVVNYSWMLWSSHS
jgi:hypothetical protein